MDKKITKKQLTEFALKIQSRVSEGVLCWDEGDESLENIEKDIKKLIEEEFKCLKIKKNTN